MESKCGLCFTHLYGMGQASICPLLKANCIKSCSGKVCGWRYHKRSTANLAQFCCNQKWSYTLQWHMIKFLILPINHSTVNFSPPPLLNFSGNRSLAIGRTNLSRIHEKLLKLSRCQGKITDVKCKKSQYIGLFDFSFSQYLTCLRTSY